MNGRLSFAIISCLALIVFSSARPDIHVYSLYGLFLFLNIAYDFFSRLGKGIPIKQVMLLIAIIQWIVAPILSYHYYTESTFYFMQVPEAYYMAYVVPVVVVFYVGLFIPIKNLQNEQYMTSLSSFMMNREVLIQRGKFLFWLGFAALFIESFSPKVLAFLFFLLSKLIFIGAFYLYASNARFRLLYIIAAFIPIILSAIQSSVFHDMFLWGGFFYILFSLMKQLGMVKKLSYLSIGIALIFFVQLIKTDYRAAIVESTADRTGIFKEVASQKLESEVEEDYGQNFIDRLNQGWIIARIMYVVPEYEPFAEGETIEQGLKAAFLPRFLMPNKVTSGGYYFERFTGISLIRTSMNLGLAGEAYANYGVFGGIIFMFLYGLFVNIVLAILYQQSLNRPELLLWIPFLFLYVIKAEDDFTTMINQFTKALYVMIGILWIFNRKYPFSTKSASSSNVDNPLNESSLMVKN